MLKAIPKEYFDGSRGTLKLLWEDEWRALGITQVCAVLHYSVGTQRLIVIAESGMGTLRGPRARAAHSALQVSLI